MLSKLEKLFSDFLWSSSVDSKKRKWIAWRKICLPVEEGGLGIRNLYDVQESLMMKFAWNLLKGVHVVKIFYH